MVPTPTPLALPLRAPLPWLLVLATVALTARAEPTPRASSPDPLDAKAPVPSVVYRSSLTLHKPTGGDQPVTWQEANNAVARIGGWRVYAREAQQSEPVAVAKPAAAQPLAAPPAPPQGHSGHVLPGRPTP